MSTLANAKPATSAGDSRKPRVSKPTQTTFDYGDIPPADATALEAHAEAVLHIQEHQRRTSAENVLKLGGELKAAQQRLSHHGNGTFNKWCSRRCDLSPQHARRMIAVAEAFRDKRLEQIVPNFAPSALYALSADTCPEMATSDAIKLAKTGQVVTHKVAKKLIAEHTIDSEAEENDEGNESPAEPDAFEFQPALFVTATRKYVRGWLKNCPPDDLHFISETLRELATKIEERIAQLLAPDSNDAALPETEEQP